MGLAPGIHLACGQCIGCRLARSRIWAARCLHEASQHEKNAFITLTYNPEHLETPTLRHRDFQLFMKRLRKSVSSASNKMRSANDLTTRSNPIKKISYYMAGEYGSQNRRPHFHACLFGHDFNDKKYYRTTGSKSKIYTSQTLDELWQHQGWTSTAEVTFESAAYIARYIISKKTGQNAGKYYEHINEKTGEITDLEPEYNKMSLKPGIGHAWLKKYAADAYPEGKILIRKHKTITPKYYDKIYKKENREEYEKMKKNRKTEQQKYMKDNTPQRLKAKETVQQAQLNQLLRKI